MTGFVLLKGECVECNNHFATCVSANNGTDCKHGFFEEVASVIIIIFIFISY